MSDFAEDIRIIARDTRFKGALGAYSPRDPIEGEVIALIEESQRLGGTTNAAGNSTGGTATSTGVNNTANQNDGDGLEPYDPNNPDSFYQGGNGGTSSSRKQGSYDFEQVFDGVDGPQGSANPYGDWSSPPVNEFTGFKDCDTGTPFDFHFDQYPTPDGWDDPETPPIDAPYLFEPGYYWTRSGGATVHAADPVTVYEIITTNAGGGVEWVSGSVVSYPYQGDPDRALVGYYYKSSPAGSPIYAEDAALREECFGPYGDNRDSLCALTFEDFTATAWPDDGKFHVKSGEGGFETSEFDQNDPGGYNDVSGFDFCFGDNRYGRMEKTLDGGTMWYETDASGVPNGNAKVYDQNGQMTAAGEYTQTFADQYLPN